MNQPQVKEIRHKSDELEERVISIDRVSRTVAGGRRLRFRALIALGDRAGRVGIGIAKATDVATAVAKAKKIAQKQLIKVAITKDGSIARPLKIHYGSSQIIFRPAPPGSSIIAGGSVRNIIELSGIKNIRAKILGSANKINNARATINALKELSR